MRLGVPIQTLPPMPEYASAPKPAQAVILNGYAQTLKRELANQQSAIWSTLVPLAIVAVGSLFEPSGGAKAPPPPPPSVQERAPGPPAVRPPGVRPPPAAAPEQPAPKAEAPQKDWVQEWLPLIDSIKWVLFAALAALLAYRIMRFAITQNRAVDVKAKLAKLGDFSLAVGGPSVQGPG